MQYLQQAQPEIEEINAAGLLPSQPQQNKPSEPKQEAVIIEDDIMDIFSDLTNYYFNH